MTADTRRYLALKKVSTKGLFENFPEESKKTMAGKRKILALF